MNTPETETTAPPAAPIEYVFPPIAGTEIGTHFFDAKTQTLWAGFKVHGVNNFGAEKFWDSIKLQIYFIYQSIAMKNAQAAETQAIQEKLAQKNGKKSYTDILTAPFRH